jgi:hypothetical protein
MDIDNPLIAAVGTVTVIADWQGQLSVEQRRASWLFAIHEHLCTPWFELPEFTACPLFSTSEVQEVFFQLLPSVER